jgi:hypothetical protein
MDVLIVDGDPSARNVLERTLRRSGFMTTAVDNGPAALAAPATHLSLKNVGGYHMHRPTASATVLCLVRSRHLERGHARPATRPTPSRSDATPIPDTATHGAYGFAWRARPVVRHAVYAGLSAAAAGLGLLIGIL